MRGTYLKVTPPAVLRDEMCGICGQCLELVRFGNGSRLVLPKKGWRVDPAVATAFGQSWLIPDPANIFE